MTGTFVACAALMLVISLSWLLRPIGLGPGTNFGRSPDGARGTRVVLAMVVPSAAIALYTGLGRFDAIEPPPPDADRATAEAMVARLAGRVTTTDDVPGLRLLARSYLQLQRPADAVRTYQRLVEIRPDDAGLELDLAEALAVAAGGRLGGEPMRHVARALELDGNEPRALALAANEAAERDDPEAAHRYWTRLQAVVPADSVVGEALRRTLADAAERATAKRNGH